MDKKILLIEDLYEEGFTSGTKARQDVRKIIDGDIFYCYIKKKSKIMDYAYSLFRLAVSFPMLYARSSITIFSSGIPRSASHFFILLLWTMIVRNWLIIPISL